MYAKKERMRRISKFYEIKDDHVICYKAVHENNASFYRGFNNTQFIYDTIDKVYETPCDYDERV